MAMDGTDFAVLGPLNKGSKTPAQLGCEVINHQPRSDRPVVLRWLPQALQENRQLIHHLQQQTALAVKLEHPSILRTHGLISFEQGWARITNFGDGEPIETLISHSPRITPSLAARIIIQISEAVQYAHEKGVDIANGHPLVHGGIRPDTVLIGFDGSVLVTGFGANVFAPRVINPFLAPEQVMGGLSAASTASDVYALGALFYTLLTGSRPFSGSTDLYQSILGSPPENKESNRLTYILVEIARSAMAKRGAQRPKNPRTFAQDIYSAIQSHQQAAATPAALASWANTVFPPASADRMHRARVLRIADDPQFAEVLRLEAQAEYQARPTRSTTADIPSRAHLQSISPQPNPSDLPTILPTAYAAERAENNHLPAPTDKLPEGVTELEPSPASHHREHDSENKISPIRSMDQKPALRLHSSSQSKAETTNRPASGRPLSLQSSTINKTQHLDEFSQDPNSSTSNLPSNIKVLPIKRHHAPSPIQTPLLRESSLPAGSEILELPLGSIDERPRTSPISTREVVSELSLAHTPSPPLDSPHSALLRNQPVKGISSPPSSSKELSSSVIQLRRRMSDGSRSMLLLIAIMVVGLLCLVISPVVNSPPHEVAPPEKKIDRSLVQHIFKSGETTPKQGPLNASKASAASVGTGPIPTSHQEDTAPNQPPVSTGLLTILTEPSVDVFLDGDNIGRTPLKLRVTTGIRRVRLTDRQTRINAYRRIKIKKNLGTTIDEVFRTSLLKVAAPPGANIYLNGHLLAQAPMAAPARIYEGDYLLKVVFRGMKWSKRLNILPGREIHFSAGIQGEATSPNL